MVAFCSAVRRSPLIVLFWKYRLWVHFKIDCIVSNITLAGQDQGNEEMGAVTVDSRKGKI